MGCLSKAWPRRGDCLGLATRLQSLKHFLVIRILSACCLVSFISIEYKSGGTGLTRHAQELMGKQGDSMHRLGSSRLRLSQLSGLVKRLSNLARERPARCAQQLMKLQ